MKSCTGNIGRSLLFVLVLHICTIISAQDKKSITLQVGDNAPSINVYKWIKGDKVTKFKKGNIYIMEFGATWCTPCRAMIPHLTEISRKYKGSISVVSIFAMEDVGVKSNDKNPAYVSRVEKFVRKQDSAMDYIIGIDGPDKAMEKAWLRASGNIGVPFTFVIDKDGKVAWIGTGSNELKQVIDIVSSKNYSLDAIIATNEKKKLAEIPPYEYNDLLLINRNGGNDADFSFRSVLVKSKGWIDGPQQLYIDSYNWIDNGWLKDFPDVRAQYKKLQGRVQTVNMSILKLYYLAFADTLSNDPNFRNSYRNFEYVDTAKFPNFKISYGKYWFKPILEVKDESPFYPQSYGASKRFHYSLKVQISQPVSATYLQEIMQRDLKNYFGYDVVVENRLMPYWKVIVLDSSKVISQLLTKTPGAKLKWDSNDTPYIFTNVDMRDIIWILSSSYGYGSFDYGKMPLPDQGPFIDETGIKAEIDFQFNNNWSFEEFRKYLNGLGLDVIKSKKEMKVVVIRDPKE